MAFKSRQPKFAIISILLTVGAFALLILASVVDQLSAYNTYLMAVGICLLIVAWGIYFFVGKPASAQQAAQENVITVIGCKGCDFREERAFNTGDYIFKELGPCKKCQGTSYIRAIYAVTPKKD